MIVNNVLTIPCAPISRLPWTPCPGFPVISSQQPTDSSYCGAQARGIAPQPGHLDRRPPPGSLCPGPSDELMPAHCFLRARWGHCVHASLSLRHFCPHLLPATVKATPTKLVPCVPASAHAVCPFCCHPVPVGHLLHLACSHSNVKTQIRSDRLQEAFPDLQGVFGASSGLPALQHSQRAVIVCFCVRFLPPEWNNGNVSCSLLTQHPAEEPTSTCRE